MIWPFLARFADLLATAATVFRLDGKVLAVRANELCKVLVIASVETHEFGLDIL